MTTLPSLFISHGAPDLPLRSGSTQDFLRQLFQVIPTPEAILMVSAHWLTAEPTVSKTEHPTTLYDFGGFPRQLYDLRHLAPGSPKLAEAVATQLTQAGFPVHTNSSRGFDHGVWTPLILADPNGTIPVVQLSIQPHETPEYHFHLGKVLTSLRDQGILIIGSGAATHNMGAFGDSYLATPPDWAVVFDQWLAEAIAQNDIQRLLHYRELAPHAVQNHPTDEHLLPLFVALGAGGPGRQLHHGFTYGAFSMSAYAFD